MTVAKPISKLLLRPLTRAEDSGMDQSEFLAITCSKPVKNRAYKVRLVFLLIG